MKHFLKGAVVTAVVIIVLLIINIICNLNGINLNPTVTGSVSAVCAMLFYHALIQKEK